MLYVINYFLKRLRKIRSELCEHTELKSKLQGNYVRAKKLMGIFQTEIFEWQHKLIQNLAFRCELCCGQLHLQRSKILKLITTASEIDFSKAA